MHLLDANVLISANALFYPLDRIPQFWDWLTEQGHAKNIKIPLEIYDEIADGTDDLADWIKDLDVKAPLLLDETPDPVLVQQALDGGYEGQHPHFNDREVEKIGRDAFLVAYGLANSERVIVTREGSRRSRRMGNRHLPDACDDCGVGWTTDYEMYRLLNFNLTGR